jgi:response regulator NasT
MIVQRPLQHNIFENQRLMNMAMSYSSQNEKTPATLDSYSVVIADDDRTMADLLAINLRRLGHRVAAIAANGREAIDMAFKTKPDVVIMDIHMPVLDGFQAAQEILATQQVAIVLSTGMSDVKSLRHAVDLNVISYLVKPFSPAQLKVAIHLAVAQSRASSDPTAANAAA